MFTCIDLSSTPVVLFYEMVRIVFTIGYHIGVAQWDTHHWVGGGGISPEYVQHGVAQVKQNCSEGR